MSKRHSDRGQTTPTHGTSEGAQRPTAHKGYLITPTQHGHHISRDGHHIATQSSMAECKRTIDRDLT